MKSASEIERTAKKIRFRPNPDVNERILNYAEAALKKSRRSEATHICTLPRNRLPRLVWAGGLAATFLIISSWAVSFVLSEKVADLRDELEIARRDIALAPTDDSATINLYLKEHQDVVARHVSLSPATPQPVQMRVSRRDILYYELFDNGLEYMRPGIIVRGPSSQREISLPAPPTIANGHTLTLAEARRAASFDLVALSMLHPGFRLNKIRGIDDREALHLLYTDGINTVSLFEQHLEGERGLVAKDFREYAVYHNKGQAGGAILAWRDDTLSYVLIGNTEMSQLMDMAQLISAGNEREQK